MANFRKALFATALLVYVLLGLAACTAPDQESSIPWSRPADWENTIPGMGK
ncbi:MAG TPA: hypothetical protein VGM73_10905 [Candidatus Didemnitutus sp.]|jgi:hypothetical protein